MKSNLKQFSQRKSLRKSIQISLQNSNNILDYQTSTNEEMFNTQESLIKKMEEDIKNQGRNLDIPELVNKLRNEVILI